MPVLTATTRSCHTVTHRSHRIVRPPAGTRGRLLPHPPAQEFLTHDPCYVLDPTRSEISPTDVTLGGEERLVKAKDTPLLAPKKAFSLGPIDFRPVQDMEVDNRAVDKSTPGGVNGK